MCEQALDREPWRDNRLSTLAQVVIVVIVLVVYAVT